jgi:hypothetical protein
MYICPNQNKIIMVHLNFLLILSTGLIPLLVGYFWYGPLFGKVWMAEAAMTDEKIKNSNMLLIFGLTLIFGLLLTIGLTPIVIHQMGVFSVLQNSGLAQEGSEGYNYFQDFMSKYGTEFRTFKHGALHGFLTSLFIFLPIIGTNALFERKSWKYIVLHVGFWAVSAILMGGIICGFA